MNVKLRKLTEEDAEYLKLYEFKNSDTAEIINLIALWNKNEYQGRYFEMFGSEYDGKLAGFFSIVETEDGKISIGPTVFKPYRKKGIASASKYMILKIAKEKGYKKAVAQIRTENTASIKLHEKMGYINQGKIINKHQNEVFIFEKDI